MQNDSRPSVFIVQKIIKILSVICFIMVFCPAFLVSCSDQTLHISVMKTVSGISVYGEQVSKPQPVLLLLAAAPVAFFVLLELRKWTDKKTGRIIAICAGIDLVLWMIFKSVVKKEANENYCQFRTTGWYVLNFICLLLIILLGVLVALDKMTLDTDLKSVISGSDTKDAINKMSSAVGQMSSAVSKMAGDAAAKMENKAAPSSGGDTIGFCPNCGKPIDAESNFCPYCGAKIPVHLKKGSAAPAETPAQAKPETDNPETSKQATTKPDKTE